MEENKIYDGPIHNKSMLDDERRDIQDKMSKALSINGMIGKTKQTMGHIYSTILEVGFGENWEDFMSFQNFITKFNKIKAEGTTSQHTDVSEDSTLNFEHLKYLINILSVYDLNSNDVKNTIISICEGYDYRKLATNLEEYFNRLKTQD